MILNSDASEQRKRVRILPGGKFGHKEVKVRNLTSGQTISIRGARSQAFRSLVERARNEGFNPSKSATQNLVLILTQGQEKGLT